MQKQIKNPTELLAALLEKDKVTHSHSIRVAILLKEFALHLGYGKKDSEELYLAGLLHDVGKLGISLEILCKPARLTAEEMETMKAHTTMASRFFDNYEVSKVVRDVAVGHHLSYKGNGYPFTEVKGNDIPEYVRIATIVDIYEALTSNERPYKKGMSSEEAFSIMDNSSNVDPVLYGEFKNFILK